MGTFRDNSSKNWWPQFSEIANIRIYSKNYPEPPTYCPSHHTEAITPKNPRKTLQKCKGLKTCVRDALVSKLQHTFCSRCKPGWRSARITKNSGICEYLCENRRNKGAPRSPTSKMFELQPAFTPNHATSSRTGTNYLVAPQNSQKTVEFMNFLAKTTGMMVARGPLHQKYIDMVSWN